MPSEKPVDRWYSSRQRVHHFYHRYVGVDVLLRLARMLQEMEATLNIYPNVKGIQVLNDMGNYLFSRYAGQWIPDTPVRRQQILRNLANWNAFSNSSPVEGITQAVQSFYDRDKKISIYVFGDEFTGRSIEEVVLTVDRLNAEAASGERRVRIHAVGFPVQFISRRSCRIQASGLLH